MYKDPAEPCFVRSINQRMWWRRRIDDWATDIGAKKGEVTAVSAVKGWKCGEEKQLSTAKTAKEISQRAISFHSSYNSGCFESDDGACEVEVLEAENASGKPNSSKARKK